ncbi:MAG: multicopper oxidase domain-containing protein [Fusobacteriaceae bacterium]
MKKIIMFFLLALTFTLTFGKVVEYNIDIEYKNVNFTGKDIEAMTLNGQVPGPILEFVEGDTLKVTFNNKMDVESSIHWHGLLLPNDQDGVSYLTTPPIKSGESFTYQFKLKQSGTYWYHSHTGGQEQRGIYGGIVIHPKNRVEMDEYVVVISDWIDEDPHDVLKNLKKDGDYYAVKKDRVQSWDKVIKNGEIKNRISNSLMRMGPMDLSDVGYDAYLINGKKQVYLNNIPKGKPIKLRIINAGASSYFFVSYSGGDMKIVAGDGKGVVPVDKDKILLGIGETYDVIVNSGGTLTAEAQDLTGKATLHIAEDPTHENHLSHDSNQDIHSMHNMHNMEGMEKANYYDFLKALEPAIYPVGTETREINLKLTGDMENYIWSFNNKTLIESDKIFIKKGEKVRFVLENETMMHHPIHLHGHFFRVINKHGEYSPIKHTVDVPPFGNIVIEFLGDEEKDWFFHCHNLYHMKTGMARVISYEGSELNKEMSKKLSWDRKYFSKGEIDGSSNFLSGDFAIFNSRHKFGLKGNTTYEGSHDANVYYSRYINNYFSLGAGLDMNEDDNRVENRGYLYADYLLPLLIDVELSIYQDGDIKAEFSSELQLTKKLQLNWEIDTEREYLVQLEYRYTKWLSFTGNTHSDNGQGVGIKIRF